MCHRDRQWARSTDHSLTSGSDGCSGVGVDLDLEVISRSARLNWDHSRFWWNLTQIQELGSRQAGVLSPGLRLGLAH